MRIQREYPDERPDRICHVLEPTVQATDGIQLQELVVIDEEYLSWFYIAPGVELSALSRQLLALVRDLLGPGYWAVVQIHEPDTRDLLSTFRCRIIESFVDGSDSPRSINVHIVHGE